MDSFRTLLKFVFFVTCVAEYVEIQRQFEFESVLTEEQRHVKNLWVWRSQASGLKTLRLQDFSQRYLVEVNICIEPTEGEDFVAIQLDDIRYANDGPYDFIFITFEGVMWSIYSTYEKWARGHEWNIFRNSGRNGASKRLPKGEYVIGVSVQTDNYGIELDNIRLIAEYQRLESDLFCGGRLIDRNATTMDFDVSDLLSD
ncbi:hypothetical protein DPMN_181444 [Dreissena polymorpha]|uniref:Uncharacterized protein n=1 Tax=Dreissena polymorpha TaxID=45954 RepID=A0A9D4I4F0_DREPO|nr:hypothetical protein DPMN_181444 [Dreissena polymorpha]